MNILDKLNDMGIGGNSGSTFGGSNGGYGSGNNALDKLSFPLPNLNDDFGANKVLESLGGSTVNGVAPGTLDPSLAVTNYRTISVRIIENTILPEVFNRGLDMYATAHSISNMVSAVEATMNRGNGTITPSTMANVSGNILKPADTANTLAKIDNGWNTRRARVIIEQEQDVSEGSKNIYYLQGYTDYFEPAIVGGIQNITIDPNMAVVINSVVVVSADWDYHSGRYIKNVVSSFNILANPYTGGITLEDEGTSYVRPSDIINGISIGTMNGEVGSGRIMNQGLTHIGTELKAISKTDMIPTVNITKLVNAKTKSRLANTFTSATEEDLLVNMSSLVENPTAYSIPLLGAVLNVFGRHTNKITFSELEMLEPAIVDKVIVYDRGQAIRDKSHQELAILDGDAHSTMRGPRESSIALVILESTLSILSSSFLSHIGYHVDTAIRDPLTNDVLFSVISVHALVDGLQQVHQLQKFEGLFKQVLLPMLFDGDPYASVRLTVMADAIGESVVEISRNGGELIRYKLPTYSNSTFASTVTTSLGYTNVVNSTDRLLSGI